MLFIEALETLILAGGSVPAVLHIILEFGSHFESSGEIMESFGKDLCFFSLCFSGKRSKYSSVTAVTRRI
jgi:hypothetical protein